MKKFIASLLGTLVALPSAASWAASVSENGPSRPAPMSDLTARLAQIAESQHSLTFGSAALVPVMTETTAAINTVETAATSTTGGETAAQPISDVAFVHRATESSRREINAAKDALPRLKDPNLKKLAEVLVTHHDSANNRLSEIAVAKGWPVPGPKRHTAPPDGRPSNEFDTQWTAEMIAGHEKSVALYRAQAQGGKDEDLRRYARETLPTIEQHLEWLRRLQK